MQKEIELLHSNIIAGTVPRVVVVGDIMLDEYVMGSVERISPEAPVQVVKINKKEFVPGGAANVANNLASLGAKVTLVGVIGDDLNGVQLLRILGSSGVDCSAVLAVSGRKTITKTRIIAHSQQVLRIDDETSEPLSPAVRSKIVSYMKRTLRRADGIIVSDYAKGIVDKSIFSELVKMAGSSKKPIIVDPKGKDYSKYRGAYIVTPNLKELEEASGIKAETEDDVSAALKKILSIVSCAGVLVTRGKDGMTLLMKGGKSLNLKASAREVYDVSGAGDTVIASFGYCLFSGMKAEMAALFANTAGGIVVEKVGTAVVSIDEVISRIYEEKSETKVIAQGKLAPLIKLLKGKRKKIVFTNGCFDILHMGHIYLLQKAKSFGDVLIVGINTDSSIRRIKGEKRPLIGEDERARVLSALACVDYVTFFDEDTPIDIIKKITPDVLVKGGDYKKNEVVGAGYVDNHGGRVELVPVVNGLSTSNIIEKILTQYK
ncbi:MAG: D-glycero-beta-D-manno-heptose-7-phosphate kinase [Candidatus Schekmanbacteria bacterium]|nr:D-glycero-beta-D-manno-heptose-7-phosphate kinase [Candidatus Schekmanbacteria bacterium]